MNVTFGSVRFEGLALCFALGSGLVRFIFGQFGFSVPKTEPYYRVMLEIMELSWFDLNHDDPLNSLGHPAG